MPKRINVVAFDFAGCGNSEGEYITLGMICSEYLTDLFFYAKAEMSPKI